MAGYFLDTSALARLYHEEAGSAYVEGILERSGASSIVSRLSLIEMESVFAIKVRTGVLDERGRLLALRRLRADIARERIRVGPPLEPRHYRVAARLLRLHGVSRGLRTLDALQLAVALDMLETSGISAMLTADKRFCEVARVCGCPAIDPTEPDFIQL